MTARVEDKGDRLVVWNGNTAKRGALSPELYACILQAVDQAQDRRIRAVIITSEGPFFCAGGDLNVLIARRNLKGAGDCGGGRGGRGRWPVDCAGL